MADTTLGNGVNTAGIYDRRGEHRLLELGGLSMVQWGRVLGDVATASVQVEVSTTGRSRDECCGDLGNIHTWNNTLVIHRNGDRCWEGPVTKVTHRAGSVQVDAWDVLGWSKKRRVHTARTATSQHVIPEAQLDLQRAFQFDNPNVLAFVQTIGLSQGMSIDRDVPIDSCYYWDDLSSMTDAGLRIATVGRRIVLAAQDTTIGRTALLLPENHILGDVEVIEDGEALATGASARDDKGHKAYVGTHNDGFHDGVDPYYGMVETIVSSGGGEQTTTGILASYATAAFNDHYPAPVVLNIPDNAVLNPSAPFPMDTLVPGTLVPASSRATCVDVDATFILTAVDVTQSAGDEASNEQVSITLAPVANQPLAAYDPGDVSLGLTALPEETP